MRKLLWIVGGIGLLAVLAMTFSRARVEVAKDKVLGKIDSLLGSMDVKRKEIEHSVAGLKDGLNGIQKAKIMAQVKQEQIARRAEPIERDVAAIDAGLLKLKEHLEGQTSLQVGGKAYQQDELKAMATKLIDRRKDQANQLEGLKAAQDRLNKVAGTLERKYAEYDKRLVGIENQLAVIDSNRVALTAMKDAARTIDSSDKGLAQSVAALEEKVNSLFADVEVELRVEDSKWATSTVRKETDAADALLNAVRTPTDTISQIDAILGTSKVVSKTK